MPINRVHAAGTFCALLALLAPLSERAHAELPSPLVINSISQPIDPARFGEDASRQFAPSAVDRQRSWFDTAELENVWNHKLVLPFRMGQRFAANAILTQQADAGTQADSASRDSNSGPDISTPGPDLGDFPNSAYTLRKGRMQLEMGPLSFRTRNANNPSAYAWPYLFRYGVTDDVEFRLLGTGLTSLIDPNPTTGFGVVTFDTKIHLWNDRMEYGIPAASFEATLQTKLGSPAFRAGTEPGISINLDFPFTKATNFETSITYSGNLTSIYLVSGSVAGQMPSRAQIAENIYFFAVQWALEHEVTEKFDLFWHGNFAMPVGISGDVSVVTGAGCFYRLSQRSMLFASANAGLTKVPAPFLTQVGIAFAF